MLIGLGEDMITVKLGFTRSKVKFTKSIKRNVIMVSAQYFYNLIYQRTVIFSYGGLWSSAHALGGVSGVASFITTDEQLQ